VDCGARDVTEGPHFAFQSSTGSCRRPTPCRLLRRIPWRIGALRETTLSSPRLSSKVETTPPLSMALLLSPVVYAVSPVSPLPSNVAPLLPLGGRGRRKFFSVYVRTPLPTCLLHTQTTCIQVLTFPYGFDSFPSESSRTIRCPGWDVGQSRSFRPPFSMCVPLFSVANLAITRRRHAFFPAQNGTGTPFDIRLPSWFPF
jgi:hypothetical protein